MEAEKLQISPEAALLNKKTGAASLEITNRAEVSYAFKIKTTHPAIYSVKPSIGVLEKGKSARIEIMNLKMEGAPDVKKQKFLVKFSPCNRQMSPSDLKELFNLKGIEVIDKKVGICYEDELKAESRSGAKKGERNFLFSLILFFVAYQILLLVKRLIFGG